MCGARPAAARGEASWKERGASGDGDRDDDTQVTSRARRHHADARLRARMKLQCNWEGTWEGPTPVVRAARMEPSTRRPAACRVSCWCREGRDVSALFSPFGSGTGVPAAPIPAPPSLVADVSSGRGKACWLMATVPLCLSHPTVGNLAESFTFHHHGKAKVRRFCSTHLSRFGSTPTPTCSS